VHGHRAVVRSHCQSEVKSIEKKIGAFGSAGVGGGKDLRVSYDKGLFPGDSETSKREKRIEICGVYSATIGKRFALRRVRGVNAVEQQHAMDAIEIRFVPQDRSHGAVAG